MTLDRRALLSGMTGATLLAPWLSLEAAMAQAVKATGTTHTPEMASHGSAEHMADMQRVMGPGLMGSEQIAMLMYPGFTALDLVGPHYFFACMFGAKVHLVTPGNDLTPVTSDLGLAIAPTVTLANVPKADIVFVPGGTDGTIAMMQRPDVLTWLTKSAESARYVTSVCTGSMILGRAGLLKGKRATSHWAAHNVLPVFGAMPVDARVVTDGKIITGAGVSAGIDFGIALVEALRGRNYAEALVLQAEYAPEPPIKGGTLATTSKPVASMMAAMFAPLEGQFLAAAKS